MTSRKKTYDSLSHSGIRMETGPATWFLACFITMLLPNHVFGQYYLTGQDDSRIRWKEIETEYFRFIFPDFFETKVREMTVYCDSFAMLNREEYGIPLKKGHRKTPVIFHVGGSYSNGLGVWAPRRIEVWTSPPQKSYSQNWLQQLMLHEYRHELQMQVLDQKGLGALTSIFGEHVAGLAAGVFVPEWYLEGDAVFAETALSESGRGRDGIFFSPAQVLLNEADPYDFNKHNFGSYRDYTFESYLLGYLLLSHDKVSNDTNPAWRRNFGSISGDFWKLAPLYRNIRLQRTYDSAMAFWKEQWRPYFADSTFFTGRQISKPQKHFTNHHVVGATDTSVIVLKHGCRQEYAIFEIDGQMSEKELCKTGVVYDNFVAHHGNRLAWCETTIQPRWNMYHNNLVVYDFRTKKRKTLTEKRDVFSPAFAQNGMLVCIENVRDTASRLVFFDSSFNELPRMVRLPGTHEFQHPAPTPECDSIYIFALGENGKSIWLITGCDADSCQFTEITHPIHHSMSDLKLADGKLYYISDASGVSRVVTLKGGEEIPVSGNRFGISDFAIADNSNKLFYSEFRKDGHTLFDDTLKPRILPYSENAGNAVAERISFRKGNPSAVPHTANGYVSKDYNHLKHLFNFHGWLPMYFNSSDMDFGLGLSAVSQNELGYSVLTTNFRWDYNEQSPSVGGNYQYLRLYPKFTISADYARRHLVSGGEKYLFNQFATAFSASVPYYISHYNHHFNFNFNANYSFSKLYMLDESLLGNPLLHSLKSTFSFSHHTGKPSQYLYNPWLQSISLQIAYGFGNTREISNIGIAGNFYFPSPVKTHSIRLYAGIQNKVKGLFTFSDVIKTPRGFRFVNPNELSASFQANYSFPIAYPDWACGNIAYFKRIHANLFCDGMFLDKGRFEKSFGTEIYLNANVLQISTPLTVGGRFSYLPDSGKASFDFLFSIDI